MGEETDFTIRQNNAKEGSPELSLVEKKERVIKFMKDGIRANEFFVSASFSRLKGMLEACDKNDVFRSVYERIKNSSTPSLERLTEAEKQYIQSVWKEVCVEVMREQGPYRTQYSEFEEFCERNPWFKIEFNDDSDEGFGEWLKASQLVSIDNIDFSNKDHGRIAYDLFVGGSTEPEIIIRMLID